MTDLQLTRENTNFKNLQASHITHKKTSTHRFHLFLQGKSLYNIGVRDVKITQILISTKDLLPSLRHRIEDIFVPLRSDIRFNSIL